MWNGYKKMERETRKVQKTGKNTLIVSLPKNWVRANGINRGDCLILEYLPEREHMIVRKNIPPHKKSCEVIYQKNESWLVREIVAKYVQGYDTIKAVGLDLWDIRRRMKKDLESILFGVNITEGENFLEISVVGAGASELIDIKDIAEKCCALVSAMIRSLVDGIASRDTRILSAVTEMDDDIDKLVLFARRQLNLMGYETFPTLREFRKVVGYNSLLQKLETMGDCVESVAGHSIKLLDERTTAGNVMVLQDALLKLGKLVDSVRVALSLNERDAANCIVDESIAFLNVQLERLRRALLSTTQKTALLMTNIVESLSMMAQTTKEMGEILLDYLT